MDILYRLRPGFDIANIFQLQLETAFGRPLLSQPT